jgi:hypothetical protein
LTGKIFLLLFEWSGLYRQSVFIPNSYVVLNDSVACAVKGRRNLRALKKTAVGREGRYPGRDKCHTSSPEIPDCFRAHTASYSMCTGLFLNGREWKGREVNHSPLTIIWFKERSLTSNSPICLSGL